MRRVLTRSAAVGVLVASLVTAEVTGPAVAETTYPSWDEVAAAKANASSAQAQVDRINGLLAGLQSSANTAADAAIQRAAELDAAQAALQAAAQKATDLASQAATATSAADTLRKQSGTLAAQLSRGGGSDVSVRLFLSDSTATTDSLLYQLGAVSKLAERSNALLQRATAQRNLASSLSTQAAAAQTVRQQRDADAKKAYDTAASAKAAADAALADQQTRADTLYAQLASLKNTQASVERQYAEGEAARKAAEQPASTGGGGGSGSAASARPTPAPSRSPSSSSGSPRPGRTGLANPEPIRTRTPELESAMKKFVNDPQKYVPDMLKGIALANPDTLRYVPEYNLIMRADAPNDGKVSIIQGSGSGHEPAHVLTVGRGMLDGACPGDVFAAPPMDYVYETTKLLASPKGVLLLVNNYTGDRMAFDMAQEMSLADGVTVRTLFIDDDVSVQDSTYTVGRRGVAGNFFVMKAVGAASEAGADLDEVVRIGEKVNSVTRTMGLALTACTPPAKGSPLFELGDDEIEIGVGIHGEPGRRRAKIEPSDALVDELLEPVVADLPFERGDRVALMVNGLGGTPISELYIAYGHAHESLAAKGITVGRSYVGEYCTSLDMAGASITLVRLDDEIESLLAAPAEIGLRIF